MKNTAKIYKAILAVFLLLGANASFADYIENYALRNPQVITAAEARFGEQIGPQVITAAEARFGEQIGPQVITAAEARFGEQISPQVTTAADPRFGEQTNPHRKVFIPASEARPPEPVLSIPIKDEREPYRYDLNEGEENRVFSSDFYLDAGIYYSGVNGKSELSTHEDGTFYETNYRCELFSTQNNGDSMAFTLDATYSNDKKAYNHTFTLNQAVLDARTRRSRLVLGHSFPEMSEFTMTQNILGIYGVRSFDSTSISAFAGYYATEREDLHNPRYVSGFRLEHDRDKSMVLGVNLVGIEDDFSNSSSSDELCEMTNKIITFDARLKPTENLEFSAEAGRSSTDFDKRSSTGEEKGDGYRLKSSYENSRCRLELGLEQGSSGFTAFMGAPPRDERAYFAGFYYELNKYIAARLKQRVSNDNTANRAQTSIKREQPEIQLVIRPSEYYKDLRIDFFYQPLREYSEKSGFMNRDRDSVWAELNQRAGSFAYYMGLSQTCDRDKITPLNNNDIRRVDFNLTYEYDKLNSVYTSYSLENIDYFRAGPKTRTSWLGVGTASRFGKNVLLNIDYMRENFEPDSMASAHDRANVSLTREYSPDTRLILNLEGNKSRFNSDLKDTDDYTAKLRYLKAF